MGGFTTILAVCILTSLHCGQPATSVQPPAMGTDSSESIYLVKEGDSVRIPAFTIQLNLSDRANALLAARHETIIVHAWFSGQPKDTATAEYREVGGLFLTEKKIELDTARTAIIDGVRFPQKLLDALASKDISVLVNVYSGRRVIPENILNCDIVDDKINHVGGKIITLPGKLIAETDSLALPATPGYRPSAQPPLAPPRAPIK